MKLIKNVKLKINKRIWVNATVGENIKEIREVELIIDGNSIAERSIFQSNHSMGCELEWFASRILSRGFDKEAKQLDEIAARLK